MFTSRPPGLTLRREALLRPHPASERFDPEFPVAMRCEKCGKYAHGPRKYMAEAMREHQRSVCPMRHTQPDTPQVMQVLYPRL
jgi:hypothetical protein